jgi:hypothetical protein
MLLSWAHGLSAGELAQPSAAQVRALVADIVAPRHFFVAEPLRLEWDYVAAEEVPWEIYKGRLLDASQTRERGVFEAWNIFSVDEHGRSLEPVLSVKFDSEAGRLHIVRAVYCYAWEGYQAGDNVYLSRETQKWLRELVTTIDLAGVSGLAEMRARLICGLFQAVVGASRLPLTSVEAPLPGFSLGRLAYLYRSSPENGLSENTPLRSWCDLVEKALADDSNELERAKLLETFLHAVPWEELPDAAAAFMNRVRGMVYPFYRRAALELAERSGSLLERIREEFANPASLGRMSIAALLRMLFNEASLTPYTDLVEKALGFLHSLEAQGLVSSADAADLLARLLCQLGRHLTAYDLVTFHHRGANYPDVLLLDAALKMYLALMEREPALFHSRLEDTGDEQNHKRRRRRALRQAWLLRRRYEGHPVPDAPTSPGENMRVLPPPHIRVPEEQILNPARRNKRLYEGDPLEQHFGEQGRAILRESIRDLREYAELRELGSAIFLDRPLGAGKGPAEPDQTPLFSYVAFSKSIARARLQYLATTLGMIPGREELEALDQSLESMEVRGIPVSQAADLSRTAIVSLADALKVADDFLLLRNTWRTQCDFKGTYFLESSLRPFGLEDADGDDLVLFLRLPSKGSQSETVALYDSRMRKRVQLEYDPRLGYTNLAGQEYPISPLHVVRVWEVDKQTEALREHDLSAAPIVLKPALC